MRLIFLLVALLITNTAYAQSASQEVLSPKVNYINDPISGNYLRVKGKVVKSITKRGKQKTRAVRGDVFKIRVKGQINLEDITGGQSVGQVDCNSRQCHLFQFKEITTPEGARLLAGKLTYELGRMSWKTEPTDIYIATISEKGEVTTAGLSAARITKTPSPLERQMGYPATTWIELYLLNE